MRTKVEQQLHGYRRGHERLAGSIRLPGRDADLVARLSDLSGTLAGNVEFPPYLTVYPLPSNTFYAVAMTWPDLRAPRSGCVLTHTLLVPMDEWRVTRDPMAVAKLFVSPIDRSGDDQYSKPLFTPEDTIEPQSQRPLPLQEEFAFVYRYFVEAKRPIVWFGHADPTATLWKILRGVWPALRIQFAACTFSLQPRTLEDRSFDLMFAPSESHPRFVKIPLDQTIDSAQAAKFPGTDVDWWRQWTYRLFGSSNQDHFEHELWDDLDDDPTAIRRLYLIESAKLASGDSPQTAVGAMDLVESMARAPTAAVRTKLAVTTRAIDVASSANRSVDGIECLRLIDDRLRRNAYAEVSPQIGPSLSERVESFTLVDPELIAESSRGIGAPEGESGSWYSRGLVRGFRKLSVSHPESLSALFKLPEVAAQLFAEAPDIAGIFATSLLERHSVADRTALRNWLSTLPNERLRPILRRSLIPRLNANDSDLLSSLIDGLTESEVNETLTLLRSLLNDPAIALLIEKAIAEEFEDATRQWAFGLATWDQGIASVASATYRQSRVGFERLINEVGVNFERRSWLLSMFLQRAGTPRLPVWAKGAIEEDASVIRTLLHPEAARTNILDSVIDQILRECGEAPVAQVVESGRIPEFRDRTFFSPLVNKTIKDTIKGFIAGIQPAQQLNDLLGVADCDLHLRQVPSWELQSLLTHETSTHNANWKRAWKALTILPDSIYDTQPAVLVDSIDSLLRRYNSPWSPEESQAWSAVLRRRRYGTTHASIRLTTFVQALKYALSNTRLPLSPVVIESFDVVYGAVTKSRDIPQEVSPLFGIFDWDKGKELRKSLIDAYFYSDWPPGDLFVACRDQKLFRKIFKRLHRKYRGDEYLERMRVDLSRRGDEASSGMARELEGLLYHPDFYEEWD